MSLSISCTSFLTSKRFLLSQQMFGAIYSIRGQLLGKGAFGHTKICVDKRSGEKLACKMISKATCSTRDIASELAILQNLPPHPNLVVVNAISEDENQVYIVMKLCKGGELKDHLVKNATCSEYEAATIMQGLMRAILCCHENHVLHLDVKPENILFDDCYENLQVKLVDFGVSTFHHSDDNETRHEKMVGTLAYMAPEVLNVDHGRSADIWSAGVILHELLTGYKPFNGETPQELYNSIHGIDSNLDMHVEGRKKQISEAAKSLVRRMLDPSEWSRLTASEVLDHIWFKEVRYM